jgi:hypothetical protein
MLLPKVAAVRSQLDPSIDVVFVIDKSTSMEDEQQRLRDNAQVIFDTLQQETSGFFRVAVVTYGGNRASAFTVKYLSLTTDRMAFIDAIDAIENRGGTEPAYNALIETMTDSIPLTETADGTFIEGLPQPTGAFPQSCGFFTILVNDQIIRHGREQWERRPRERRGSRDQCTGKCQCSLFWLHRAGRGL